jgi:hypothetical protein
MAGKKSSKDKRGRQNYVNEGRASRNKQRNLEKEAARVEFYTVRNEIMKTQKLGKADAKRVARLVLQGLDEAEALNLVKEPKVGDTPTDKE